MALGKGQSQNGMRLEDALGNLVASHGIPLAVARIIREEDALHLLETLPISPRSSSSAREWLMDHCPRNRNAMRYWTDRENESVCSETLHKVARKEYYLDRAGRFREVKDISSTKKSMAFQNSDASVISGGVLSSTEAQEMNDDEITRILDNLVETRGIPTAVARHIREKDAPRLLELLPVSKPTSGTARLWLLERLPEWRGKVDFWSDNKVECATTAITRKIARGECFIDNNGHLKRAVGLLGTSGITQSSTVWAKSQSTRNSNALAPRSSFSTGGMPVSGSARTSQFENAKEITKASSDNFSMQGYWTTERISESTGSNRGSVRLKNLETQVSEELRPKNMAPESSAFENRSPQNVVSRNSRARAIYVPSTSSITEAAVCKAESIAQCETHPVPQGTVMIPGLAPINVFGECKIAIQNIQQHCTAIQNKRRERCQHETPDAANRNCQRSVSTLSCQRCCHHSCCRHTCRCCC
jgi:hypothetical protein